jgi:hypothetical protein
MIDIEKINRLLAWHGKYCPNILIFERNFYDPLVKTLGDDEAEIILTSRNANHDTRQWISSLIEELRQKFPGAEMEAAIDARVRRVWPDAVKIGVARQKNGIICMKRPFAGHKLPHGALKGHAASATIYSAHFA